MCRIKKCENTSASGSQGGSTWHHRFMAEPREITVLGETFVVSEGDTPAVLNVEWISGRNAGYGFTSNRSGNPVTDEEIEILIRAFLAQVDDRTGYIGED